MKKNTNAPPNQKVVQIKHKHILPAAGNREDGSGLDKKSLKELADTIIEHGIVQPLTVRTHPEKKDCYELICGQRRWMGAEIAGLDEVPCIVRECGDAQAIAIRAIENLQREGISELEEAKNYQQLLALKDEATGAPAYTFDTLAATLGKSPVWVRARVKLLELPDIGKLALTQGKLTASVALLISRILNPADAHKATLEVLVAQSFGRTPTEEDALDEDRKPMSYRAAKEHIQDKYMKRLKGAPFDQEVAELVPEYTTVDGTSFDIVVGAGTESAKQARCGGGKCSTCPFRTGNMKKTYPDAESADVCTNTDCFKSKVKAHEAREKAKFEAKGQKLLKEKQAAKILNYNGDEVRAGSGYIDLRATIPGKKKTWEEALDGHFPEDFTPEVARGKKNFLVAPVAVIEAAAKAAGLKVETPKAEEPRESYEQQQERRNEAKRKSLEIAKAAMAPLTKAITKDKPEPFLQFLALHLLDAGYTDRHNIKGGDTGLQKHIKGLSDGELRCAIMEAQFLSGDVTSWEGELREDFTALCAHYDVDLKAIAKELKAKAKDEPAQLESETEGEQKKD
jgi:ParB/RepB/Spo0J family partition protein